MTTLRVVRMCSPPTPLKLIQVTKLAFQKGFR